MSDTLRIDTKDVRQALRRLIDELDKADLSSLAGRVRMKGKTRNVDAWVETLKTAESELAEWCPNLEAGPNQFTIDVAPKTR